ncbi:Gifsy-2 prophage MsgA (modular protein) [Klebsiella pneumoniae subsp. pneumoniae BJ1-GA]|nr:Gifsy-2 prophage MsgA (modular protein) [Klebsiella pneumoniae subsp. pneumoniae BJ1-GA]
MFVELIYDKRNFAGLPGAREAILNELTKRMQRIFPEAEVRAARRAPGPLPGDGARGGRSVRSRLGNPRHRAWPGRESVSL